MSKCPACEQNIKAQETVVGDFHTLCKKHKKDIDRHLKIILRNRPFKK